MKKTLGSALNQSFSQKFVEIRKSAGLTQRDMAKKVNRERSFIARIELGERRVDLAEFFQICVSLGLDPTRTAQEVFANFQQVSASQN